MRCCICKQEIYGESFDPKPLCANENERCCNMCYSVKVLTARAMLAKHDKPPITVGDKIIVVFSQKDIDSNGDWLKGEVTALKQENGKINYYGTWGNFPLNREEDVYIKVD